MTFSMRRFQAIVQKEYKDSVKNPQVLLMAGLPVLLAFIYGQMSESSLELITFPLLMALSMTGAFVQAMLIAEEKEKHTLRVLMMSPANGAEVMLGKSLITALITALSMVLSILVTNTTFTHLGLLTLLSVISLIMFLAFGIIIGLLSRTVQESTIVGLPVILIFVFGAMFGPMMNQPILTKIVYYLPSYQYLELINALEKGVPLVDQLNGLWIMLGWMVLSLVAVAVAYRKKSFDK